MLSSLRSDSRLAYSITGIVFHDSKLFNIICHYVMEIDKEKTISEEKYIGIQSFTFEYRVSSAEVARRST